MPPMVSADHPSANVYCSKSARKESRAGAIHIGQEATQARPMGQTPAPKQRHEGRGARYDALKEVRQGPFPADGISSQQPEKIDGLIAAEASSDQAHPARVKASSSPCA